MKKIALLFLVFFSVSASAQLQEYSFEALDTLKNNKPIIVFLHTNWCKYCKAMQQTTFKNEKVVSELNEKFYFIPFNAESKETITFHGHKFNYKATGNKIGVHELAEILGTYNNKLEYPTTVVLNTKYEIILQYPAMLRPNSFLGMLNSVKQ